ncbi:hypothetical protein L7F22_032453 [Adiantum nelumboides]|nr:hypothetical protein [Adiantum nelumboides]
MNSKLPDTSNVLPKDALGLDSPNAMQARPGPIQHLQKNIHSVASPSDVSKAVLDLVGATQQLQEDPTNMESINNLVDRLKHLLLQEREVYAFMRQNSESRKKLNSLHNLIQYLESQVQRLQRAAQRRGLKYYLANLSNKVRGNEVGRIGQSMESELQSWLDQQRVREVAVIISKGTEEEQVQAISSFASVVQKGYNSLLQDTILSAGLVEKLAGLLAPGAASWRVAKEAAFALSALIDFNKDIFVSLVLMAKMVENILRLMNSEPDDQVLILVSVMKNMLSAGHTIVVDEIFAHTGVSKFVELLDHELQALQLAAMDCIFELAYYGRVDVVDKLFKLEVVKKLALLQQNAPEEELSVGIDYSKQQSTDEESSPIDMASKCLPPAVSLRLQEDAQTVKRNPFADAVIKFALHLSIGTGLRKREKRELKQEFLRQIREVLEDDTEVANITAEVLWAP